MRALNLGANRYLQKVGEVRAQYRALADAILQEVGHQKLKEELREERRRAQRYLDIAEVILVVIDPKEKVTLINKKGCEILGYPKNKIMGKNWYEEFFPKDNRESARKIHKRLRNGRKEEVEYCEYPIVTKDNEKRTIAWRNTAVRNPKGEFIGVLSSGNDITDRKEAEERQNFLHSLLRHDLRNKIQIVQGYLELLREAEISDKYRNYLEKAVKASRRGYDLIEEVRALRKIEKKQKILDVNMGAVISEVIEENQAQAKNESFEIEYNRKDITVKGGPLLKVLVSNLIKNSIQHSKGNKIVIRNKEERGFVRFIFEDNGEGIPKKNKDKIFDRSWAGKNSRGSGLGLHLVKKIAISYGGNIELKDSKLGGARFDLMLEKA